MASLRKNLKLVGLVLSVLLIGACGGSDVSSTTEGTAVSTTSGPAETTPPETTETSLQAGTETLSIGLLAELSGAAAEFGVPFAEGAHLAVEDINANGGITVGDVNYMLELVEEDTRSDPTVGLAAAASLVEDQGIKYVVGGIFGGAAVPVAEYARDVETFIHLTPTVGVEASLLGQGGEGPVFMIQNSQVERGAHAAAGLAEFLEAEAGLRIGVLGRNDDLGANIIEAHTAEFADAGYEVVETLLYEPGTRDFSTQLVRLGGDIDVLAQYWLPTEQLLALEQAVDLGTATSGHFLYGADPSSILEIVGSDYDLPIATVLTPITIDEPTSDLRRSLAERLRENLSEVTAAAGAYAFSYDGVMLLAAALEEAGTVTDHNAVISALEVVSAEGALGTVSFDEDHIIQHGNDVCVLRSGAAECAFFSAGSDG